MSHFLNKLNINESEIENAITDFENSVDFELVPVIAAKSTSILHVKWIVSVSFFLLFFSVLELLHVFEVFKFTVDQLFYAVGTSLILSLVIGFYLARFESVCRLFTFKSIRDEEVQNKAEQVFFQKRIFETHSKQGLLVFISLLEHRVVILPDQQLDPDFIHKISEKLLECLIINFKKNDFQGGLLSGIKYLKSELGVKFAKKVQDKNQIPNRLIWID